MPKQTFYFTYGSSCETMPYQKGWTEVRAESREEAVKFFRLYHPDVNEGFVNCADIYSQAEFERTEMGTKGNFGVFAHETINVIHWTAKEWREAK